MNIVEWREHNARSDRESCNYVRSLDKVLLSARSWQGYRPHEWMTTTVRCASMRKLWATPHRYHLTLEIPQRALGSEIRIHIFDAESDAEAKQIAEVFWRLR